jgi:hypothetical protein
MWQRQWRLAVATGLLGACGGDTAGPVQAPGPTASKVAVLAIAVATGDEGRAFFDNFIPCPRRGVIDYTNTPAGRRATFSGCDAGDGVVVDGDAEVRWVEAGNRERIARIEVGGVLRVRTGDGGEVTVNELTVTGVSFASSTEPSVLNLVTDPVRVTALGATTPLDPRASPANVFAPAGRSMDAIPNPSGSLDALTDVDLKAIAYGAAMRLASLLFDETLESQRGEHDHQLPCGRVHVIPDPSTRLVRIENTWTSCDLESGIFVGGTFTQRWAEFDGPSGRLSMVIEGQPALGGNVPRIVLSRYEWSVTALPTPGMTRFSGRLVAGGRERTFSFDVRTDD